MKLLPFAILIISLGAAFGEGVSFNRDVRPILSDKCFYCHGTDPHHRKGDRRLDTREGALADIDGVKAIVPGNPEESDAIIRILSDDKDELMPLPKSHKTLTAAEKETLRRWVAEGAKYEAHWAFVAPVRPALPDVEKGKRDGEKAQGSPFLGRSDAPSAIDAFIEQRLQKDGLAFSPQAEKGALLRRVTLDLTGLPPTLPELDAFEKDAAPGAYERVVDRLLASPRYGEQMAMPWLDGARYADTNGYQMDAYRMQWPWRDWVVRAFNANMPFDQFTIEQLAGDLLPNPTQGQLVATAFNRNHMLNAEGGTTAEENRTKNVFDRVETTGTTWLGLTMNCTQCHDHKFDPLTQRDYFAMYAMFNQLSEPGGVDKRFGKKSYSDGYDNLYMVESPYLTLPTADQKETLAAAVKAREQAEAVFLAKRPEIHPSFSAWVEEMRARPELIEQRTESELDRRAVSSAKLDNYRDGNTKRLLNIFLASPGREAWLAAKDAAEAAKVAEEDVMQTIPHVMVMRDDKPRETRILKRGNYETPGDVVTAAVPAFLPHLPEGAKPDRLALSRWLVSPENPLMARVTVNRLWQQFFGRGLVKTPDDFGLKGALPSHPELLDWLAVEFRESGWDVKRFVRLLVTSRTYRQSAKVSPALLAKDPENALLARGPRFRLDSRLLRDQALALSGLLVEKRGGPPVMPYQPPGIWEEMSFGKNRYFQGTGEDLYRRSLYTFWRRSVAPASFFDVPAREVCVVKPYRTSTPLHALTTLNDTTYVEAARVWAEKLLTAQPDDASRLTAAFCAATTRAPEARELANLKRSLEKARAHLVADPPAAAKLIATGEAPRSANLDAREHAAWTTLCLLVLNLDETLNR
jgi:hypothetical protein